MNPDPFTSATFEGAALNSQRELMKLTPAERVIRAAELSDACLALAVAGEAARRKAATSRTASTAKAVQR